MTRIDSHVHLFKAVSAAYPRRSIEKLLPASLEETAEQFLPVMRDAGVDVAVVTAVSEHDEYLAKVLTDYPTSFVGIGVLDFDEDDLRSQVDRRVEATGMQGFRCFGFETPADTAVERMKVFPALEMMMDHDLKLWFYGTSDQLELLNAVLELLPQLKVVLNHLGFCPDLKTDLMVDELGRPFIETELPPASLGLVEQMARRHENLYVHFSGFYGFSRREYPYDDLSGVVRRLHAAFGANRMLLASDWPFIKVEPGYERTLELVDAHLGHLTTIEQHLVKSGNARWLFGLD